MFPREDFFGFILIKTWMLNIITNSELTAIDIVRKKLENKLHKLMGIDGHYWHPEVRKSDWIFHGTLNFPEVRIKLEKSN
jgi:hypothetical protein